MTRHDLMIMSVGRGRQCCALAQSFRQGHDYVYEVLQAKYKEIILKSRHDPILGLSRLANAKVIRLKTLAQFELGFFSKVVDNVIYIDQNAAKKSNSNS